MKLLPVLAMGIVCFFCYCFFLLLNALCHYTTYPKKGGQAQTGSVSVGAQVPKSLMDFLDDVGIAFRLESRVECDPGLIAAQLTQSPGGVGADQGLFIPQGCDKGRHGGRIAGVAQGHGRVAQQPSPLGALGRMTAEMGVETIAVHGKQFRQGGIGETGTALEGGLGGRGGLAIPGADILADVAAENPVAYSRTQVAGDGSLQLDGQVGNTAAGRRWDRRPSSGCSCRSDRWPAGRSRGRDRE